MRLAFLIELGRGVEHLPRISWTGLALLVLIVVLFVFDVAMFWYFARKDRARDQIARLDALTRAARERARRTAWAELSQQTKQRRVQ